MPVRFDTKIAVLLRDDLETWQRLNVTAFLASGIAANPELLGEPYADADGTPLPADVPPAGAGVRGRQGGARPRRTSARSRRGLPTAVFTAELFATGHDEANRAAVRGGAAATSSTWSASRCTGRATRSTRCSRARVLHR